MFDWFVTGLNTIASLDFWAKFGFMFACYGVVGGITGLIIEAVTCIDVWKQRNRAEISKQEMRLWMITGTESYDEWDELVSEKKRK